MPWMILSRPHEVPIPRGLVAYPAGRWLMPRAHAAHVIAAGAGRPCDKRDHDHDDDAGRSGVSAQPDPDPAQ
jgi:hypothetical protein